MSMALTGIARGAVLGMVAILTFASCQRAGRRTVSDTPVPAERAVAQNPNPKQTLVDAQNKLEDVITQPASPFRLTYSKSGSDGYSLAYDVLISSAGIKGNERLLRPQASAATGSDTKPEVRALDGTPIGSNAWRFIANDLLTSFGSNLQYAGPGARYVGEESTGGFETRRYDFDLANVSAMNQDSPVNAGLVSNSKSSQQPKYYSFKGSAWVANDDGRLVKAQYDHITTFSNGTKAQIHYDLAISRE